MSVFGIVHHMFGQKRPLEAHGIPFNNNEFRSNSVRIPFNSVRFRSPLPKAPKEELFARNAELRKQGRFVGVRAILDGFGGEFGQPSQCFQVEGAPGRAGEFQPNLG